MVVTSKRFVRDSFDFFFCMNDKSALPSDEDHRGEHVPIFLSKDSNSFCIVFMFGHRW